MQVESIFGIAFKWVAIDNTSVLNQCHFLFSFKKNIFFLCFPPSFLFSLFKSTLAFVPIPCAVAEKKFFVYLFLSPPLFSLSHNQLFFIRLSFTVIASSGKPLLFLFKPLKQRREKVGSVPLPPSFFLLTQGTTLPSHGGEGCGRRGDEGGGKRET